MVVPSGTLLPPKDILDPVTIWLAQPSVETSSARNTPSFLLQLLAEQTSVLAGDGASGIGIVQAGQ